MKTHLDIKRPAHSRRPASALIALLAPIALLAVAASTSSCVLDLAAGDPRQTTFTLTLPPAQDVATRATVSQENTISSLTLLLCGASGGVLQQGGIITIGAPTGGGDNNRYTFRAPVPFDKYYDLLFVANASPATLASLSVGDTQDQIQTKLRQSKPAGTAWSIDGSSVERSIPMFGRLTNKKFDGTAAPEPVALRRMLARVNVTVAEGARGAFKLNGVYFYNYNLVGNLIPGATDPSVPSQTRQSASLAYTSLSTANIESRNQIYVFENSGEALYPAPGWKNNPCVVVRGAYADGADSYYRLDFVSGSTLLNLIRNHSYNFTISSVSGPGYASADEARNSAPQNMAADVLAWDDADLPATLGGTIHTVTTGGVNGSVVANYTRAYAGMTIRVAAVPATGYKFTGWTTTPATTIHGSATNPAEFTIAANTTVTPTFAKSDGKFPVGATVNPASGGHTVAVTNQGSVVPITEATAGSGVSFAATPGAGKVFKRWSISGPAPYGFDPTANPLHVQMPEWALTLEGFFAGENEYIFFVQANLPDAPNTPIVQPASSAADAAVTITAPAAKTGYTFKGWELSGGLTLNSGADLTPRTITVKMPNHDNGVATAIYGNITATAGLGVATATVTAKGGATPIEIATAGQEVTFTATAKIPDKTVWCGWTVTTGATPIDFDPMANPLTITMPSGPLTLTARYDSGQILIVRNPGTDEAYLDLGVWPDDFSTDPASEDYYLKKIAFFKWGSVVAMDNIAAHNAFDSDPTVANNAVTFNPATTEFSGYTNIPYGDIATNLTNVQAGKGDPCQLVGLTAAQLRAASPADEWETNMENSKWRLPTHVENHLLVHGVTNVTAERYYDNIFVSKDGSPAVWSESNPGFARMLKSGGVVLPAAGYRHTAGEAAEPGVAAAWRSLTRNVDTGADLVFRNYFVRGSYSTELDQGAPFRCVPQSLL